MDDHSIWSVYHRNTNYYYTCKDYKTCPSYLEFQKKICYCFQRNPIRPIIIGECGFICDNKPLLNKRCYIKFGEPCTICLNSIKYKKNAWITPCGHIFHKMCLINYYRHYETNNSIQKYSNEMPCPICREGLVLCCIGEDSIDYYNELNSNGLDRLENFWLTIENRLPELCYKCKKILGFNKKCNKCLNYRKRGYI